ncbi:MAG: hypothetical protein WCF65_01900 [Parachlamydiaceae bacterium]
MRRILILSLCLLVHSAFVASAGSASNGWPLPKPCQRSPWPSSFVTYGAAGLRCDKFKWSIPGLRVNTRSELQWRDLRIFQYQAMAEYTSCSNYVLRLDGDFGNIYHGHYRDADYLGNDKTFLESLSHGAAGQGYVYDASIAAGYRVTSTCNRFIASPLLGYSEHAQYLHMYHGYQDFSLNPFLEHGPFPGLNSRYTTRWFGPWFGMDFEARVEQCASLFGSFKWHMLTYRGHGHWNLRRDIGPFYHSSYGYGYEGTLGTSWEIWGNWSIGLIGSYKMYRTKSGHERNTDVIIDGTAYNFTSGFNGAIWHSFNISGLIAWRF